MGSVIPLSELNELAKVKQTEKQARAIRISMLPDSTNNSKKYFIYFISNHFRFINI